MAGLYCGLQEPSGFWFALSQRRPARTAFSLFSLPPILVIAAMRAVPPARPAMVEGSLPMPAPIAAAALLMSFAMSVAGAFTCGIEGAIWKAVGEVLTAVITSRLWVCTVGVWGVNCC